METVGFPLTVDQRLVDCIRNSVCGWCHSQEILPSINVFGLCLPHAGCLEDTDKWLDYETWNAGRQIVPSPLQ